MTILHSIQPSKRIFSGIQPTGNLHLGNYLGAIKNWVNLQEEITSIFSIVDMHAITVPQDPKTLRASTYEVAAAIIAAGIDIQKSILFNQSSIKEHAELAWILNCVCRIGWLNRMTQFKEKAGKNKENATIGLYNYPVLMAADILLYRATHVPVGDDQKQHIELTRDIASSFNSMFTNDEEEDFFCLPEPQIIGPAKRVMSLRDGSKKMSKSDPSDFSRIMLRDSKDEISQKIRKARTDPLPLPESLKEAQKRPEALNLLTIFASLSNKSTEKIIDEYAGTEFSKFKKDLADLSVDKISPISLEMQKLMTNSDYLDQIIKAGREKATEIARPVLSKVYEVVGLKNI